MKGTALLFLLCAASLGEHILVPLVTTWSKAQAFCRAKYFDLSSIESERDLDNLREAGGGNITSGWIGLHRESVASFEWKWSRGEAMTYENWGPTQPDNANFLETVVEILTNGKWNDLSMFYRRPFYCSRGLGLQVKMTWEKALDHCRETHTNLTSLHSETDTLEVLEKLQKKHITEPVWIGLRFFGDRWLWVDGDPLEHKAWSKGDQDHQCPVRGRCGALTEEGVWESHDCQEKRNFICK